MEVCNEICSEKSDECVDEIIQEKLVPKFAHPNTTPTCVDDSRTSGSHGVHATNKILQLNRSIKWRCTLEQEQNKRVRNLEPSLEYPVGASFASITLRPPNTKPKKYLSIQSYATCLMAFGEIYITPEEEWDTLVLNRIIADGKKHTESSLEMLQDRSVDELIENYDGSINENLIEKTFVKCGNTMEIDVISPFIVGTVVSTRKEIPDFHYGIEKFMRKFTYSLLTVDNFYFLIWRNSGIYFVFDCLGRDNKLKRNSATGMAVLIAVARIADVNHLIVNLSNFKGSETFVLRNVRMKAIYPCCEFINKIERRIRQQEFQIINDNCAFLRGHYEISSPCFKENRNKFSLAVAVVALVYSKIDPPSTWDSYCIDKTLFLANNFYSMWTNCLHHRNLRITQIPEVIQLGKYVARISVSHPQACGKWRSLSNYKSSDLAKSIEEIFENNSNLIVNIGDRWYALWKRASFYYLLDPYKHDCQSTKGKGPSAELYLCNTLSYLICIFINNVIEATTPVTFNIHNLKVLDIRSINVDDDDEIHCECIGELSKKLDDEVATLNLSIDDVTCMKELQCEILDDRDKIDCVNLDSPSLSQTQIASYDLSDDEAEEEEELDEEETETEDSDLSSDSDGEGGRRKKKKSKSKGKTKKGKDKKGKDKKKKGKKDKDKKGKDKKVKDKKVKDKKVKDKKVKGKKERKEKDKKIKDKKDKSKDKKSKDKKDKDKKKRDKKDKEQKDKKKTRGKDKKDKDAEHTDTEDRDTEGTTTEDTDKDETNKEETDREERDKEERDREETGENATDKDEEDSDRDISGSKSSSQIGSSDEQGHEIGSDEIGKYGSRGCLPNSYPGFSTVPFNMAVVGSKTGSYDSLCSLLQTGFKCADRILAMTPWGNYIVFEKRNMVLLYEGCTCNVSRFRHLDVTVGTAGLLCFDSLHDLIEYIINNKSPKITNAQENAKSNNLENIIDEYCNQCCK